MNDLDYLEYFGVWPIHTRGTAEGVILKYKKLYLKIYHNAQVYTVEGYHYGDELPAFVDEVKYEDIYKYGKLYKEMNIRSMY